ncbi:MAG: hypothetical protein HF976_00345 [ANME-2 cluster archaeon]|nr:hypothetical protein [ANME-2 cluster archaeon]MBC2706132.1 hypothetical protein [ANME-2 cluster archaeon]MBC2747221.1 hypothetical protein [ANME-2 cluster archaeon]
MFLDFKAATSDTKIDSQVITAWWSAPSDTKVDSQDGIASNKAEIDLTGELYFFVEEDDGLSEVLKSRLEETLHENGIEIHKIEKLENKYDGKVLMVAILKQDVSYNPFFPSANLNVLFSYSSNGNTSYFEAQKRGSSPVFIIREHKGLFIEGQQQLTDDSRGIISLRAYQNHLADEVAKDILLKLRSGNK